MYAPILRIDESTRPQEQKKGTCCVLPAQYDPQQRFRVEKLTCLRIIILEDVIVRMQRFYEPILKLKT